MPILNLLSIDTLKAGIKSNYRRADQLSRGSLGILVYAVRSFTEANAAQAAASIAYYALFSLFPLLIFLVTIASSFLQGEQVIQQILGFVAATLPPAEELIAQNIERILTQRGTMNLIAGVGLLWAATGVFAGLTRNINKAWHTARPSNFLRSRLVGLIIVALLFVMLMLSLLSTTLFNLLPSVDVTGSLWDQISLYETFTWQLASRLVPWFFTFVLCLGVYRWIPTIKVGWLEVSIGAALVATAGEITKAGFTWYVSSGLAQYDLVYGSLGTIIVVMLSIYIGSIILLFGAHLSAAISYYRRQKR